MSRKPTFLASRDRGAVNIDIDKDVPTGGAYVDLDGEDPNALFDIEEIDDTPLDDRGRPTVVDDPLDVTEDELRGLSDRTQNRIKRVIFERETERRGRETAVRELNAATEHGRRAISENERLRATVTQTTSTLAASMLKERESAMVAARQKLAEAHSSGDSEAFAAATEEVSAISAELTLVRAQQAQQARQPVAADPQQPTQREAAPTVDPDVVEWIARNTWFNKPGGEEKTAIAMATHRKLIASGIKPGNPEYLQGLDEGMKKLFPDHRAPTDKQDLPTGRGPQRRGDVVNGGERREAPTSPRKVALTASEINLAKNLGITPQAYAAGKVQYEARNKGSAR